MNNQRNLLIGLLLLTAATFIGILGFDHLQWDDNYFLFFNPASGKDFFTALKVTFGAYFFDDYLPFTLMTFWADHAIAGGVDSGLAHGINLALHLANVALLWWWLRGFSLSTGKILFICAVFALHPVQVESVAWISERKGLLCAFFTLLSLICAQRNYSYFIFFLLALLSKATTIFTPFLLMVSDRVLHGLTFSKILKRHGPAALLSVLFVYLRIHAYSGRDGGFANALHDPTRWIKTPAMILNGLGFYVYTLLWPSHLSVVYPPYEPSALYLLLFPAFAAVVLWGWWRTRNTLITLMALFAALYLLPVLQIIPRLNYVSDRYLYLPVIGFAALFILSVDFQKIPARALQAALVVLCLGLASLAHSRSKVWQSDLALWQATALELPNDGLVNLSLGSALEKNGQINEAIEHFLLSAKFGRGQDTSAQAYSNISSIYSKPEYTVFYDLKKADEYMQLALLEPIDDSHGYFLRYNALRLKAVLGDGAAARQMGEQLLRDLDKVNDTRMLRVRELTQNVLSSIPAANR